jgi:ribosome-binding protein aMBF1 (putative translation factor)
VNTYDSCQNYREMRMKAIERNKIKPAISFAEVLEKEKKTKLIQIEIQKSKKMNENKNPFYYVN